MLSFLFGLFCFFSISLIFISSLNSRALKVLFYCWAFMQGEIATILGTAGEAYNNVKKEKDG